MSLIKQKPNIKLLGEKCQILRYLEKDPQTEVSVKNMMYPTVKSSSIETSARAFANIRIIACA